MATVFNLFHFNVKKRVGHTVYIHLTRDKTKICECSRKNENCFFFCCQILNVLWYILLRMETRGEAVIRLPAPCNMSFSGNSTHARRVKAAMRDCTEAGEQLL